MKIIITGTHLTPSLAVIDELKKFPGTKIAYIGRATTMEGDKTKSVESQVLKNMDINFIPLTTGRLQRSFTVHTIPSLLKIPIGLAEGLYYLLKEKPDVVLSMGGYVSVPVVISAWLLKIPIIVHEQTLVPGLANNINSLFADKIAVSFEQNFSKNNKIVLTGNPLRNEILNPSKPKDSELNTIINQAIKSKQPLIFVTGGNQGSHTLNGAFGNILDEITEISYVVHQTGDSKFKDFEKLEIQKDDLKNPGKYLVRKWIDAEDLGFLLKHTDIVVCRAGINTLLELAYFSIPAISVPLPHNKEQDFNADYFEKIGMVIKISQNNLNEKVLINNLSEIIKNLKKFKKAAQESSKLIIRDAAKRLALETVLLAGKRS